MKNMHDVVVVGAGPVGLVAALVLARSGIKVTVFEKRADLNTASKASTFHPPTLEILERLDVLAPVKAQGQLVDRVQYRTPADGILGELHFSRLNALTSCPFRMHLEQSRLTPILLERLLEHPNAQVHFETELTGLQTGEDQVQLQLRSGDETLDIQSRYVIGTDGAHSAVRTAAGITFEGAPYPGKVLRYLTNDDLDTLLPGIGPITYLVSDSHSASFLKMPDCWRIILRVPADVSDEEASSDAWAFSRLSPLIPGMKALPNCIGKDLYAASKRVAGAYKQGNVVLAGDSAHLSNTRGGMNMNCGIHDAFHIAQAIAAVIQGGDPSLVDAATQARQRVANEMLIPRSDTMVSTEGAWIDRVRTLLTDDASALVHLQQTAMLDMTTAPTSPASANAS